MKVFCRFAPMAPPSASDAVSAASSSIGRVPGVPLVLRVSEREAEAGSEEVLLVDPVTRSHASFACDGVFVASSLESTVVYLGDSVVRTREADRQRFSGDQEALYARLFAHVSRHSLQGALPPTATQPSLSSSRRPSHLFLTYGQTSSGKTYTLFGPTHGAGALTVRGPCPTAGVVPRFFHDVFQSLGQTGGTSESTAVVGVVVDLTCMEIYNEVTTDVAALALEQARTAAAEACAVAPRRRTSQLSRLDATSAGPEPVMSPVEVAFTEYRRQQQQQADLVGEVMPACLQVTYKVTEKSKLRRSCVRLRCRSAAECWAVTTQLLELRQSSLTERNAHSSRGHLLLRAEVYATSPSSARLDLDREVLFVDLAGSESQRDVGLSAPSAPVAAAASGQGPHAYHRSLSGGSTRSLGGASAESFDSGFLQPRRARRRSSVVTNNSSFGFGGGGSPDSTTLGSTSSGPTLLHSLRSGTGLQRGPHHRRSASLTVAARLNPAVDQMRAEAATHKRSQELRHINTSLLALRKVIHALHVASRQRRTPSVVHAPFKDSTLTTVLEPYLLPTVTTVVDGRGVAEEVASLPDVVFLVCCSSQQRDFHETVSSLRLGAEASSVKPTVVLQSLPACRAPPATTVATTTNGSGATSRSHSSRAFARSHSAPVRGEGAGLAKPMSASLSARPPAGLPAQPTHATTTTTAASAAVAALNAKEREELDQLRREVQSYKATALDLYAQCRELCDNYARSVKELAAAKVALAERDARLAALAAPPSSRALDVLAPPPPLEEMNDGEPQVREVSAPRLAAGESPARAWKRSATPWSVGRDVVISADTTLQVSPVGEEVEAEEGEPQQDEAAQEAQDATRAESPVPTTALAPPVPSVPAPDVPPGPSAEEVFRASVLRALLQRQVCSPLVEADDTPTSTHAAEAAPALPTTTAAGRGLSAVDLNCTAGRSAKTSVSSAAEGRGLENGVPRGDDGIPRAPPLHVFRL